MPPKTLCRSIHVFATALFHDYNISSSAIIQLDQVLRYITLKIIARALEFQAISRSTLTLETVIHAIESIFSGDLMLCAIHYGQKNIRRSTQDNQPHFSIKYFRTLIQMHIPEYMRLSKQIAPFLTSILEYLCFEILDLAISQAYIQDTYTVEVYHLHQGTQIDLEIKRLLQNLGIVWFTTIHDKLQTAGSITRDITRDPLIITKTAFRRSLKPLLQTSTDSTLKIDKHAMMLLQFHLEKWTIQWLQHAYELCKHANRIKVTQKDLLFAYHHHQHSSN